ncbi:inhibin beta A chain [Drosophila ficusphila]|uniref:inhibin beta A chain n=1 Tax=Drosophila ficusphila TaxID=30025 RepID=UPI0007E65697|nr:inhibin beta A chain [Drosophila ficusphila]
MIIYIEPNFTPQSKPATEFCGLFTCICKARNSKVKKFGTFREETTLFFSIILQIYFYHSQTLKHTVCFKNIKPKLDVVYTKSQKYSRIWFILILLLPTLHEINGHEMSGQTSNLNGIFSSRKQYDNSQLSSSPPKNLTIKAESVRTYQLQLRIQTKISRTEKNLNNLFKRIRLQRRGSVHNASLKNTSYLNNQETAVEPRNTLTINGRKTREIGDILLGERTVNKQPHKKPNSKQIDAEKLKRLILKGLGMKKIPDMRKVNISQVEYSNKYIEYLNRLKSGHEKSDSYFNNYLGPSSVRDLHLLSIVSNKFNDISNKRWRHKRSLKTKKRKNKAVEIGQQDKTNILLHFPLTNLKNENFHYDKIDEANVRLMLLYSSSLATNSRNSRNRKFSHIYRNNSSKDNIRNCNFGFVNANQSKKAKSRHLVLKVYQRLSANRRALLTSRKIEFENIGYEETRTQWIEFDVTKAVRCWLNNSHENLGIEIQCDKCKSVGARILSDSSPKSSQSSSAKSSASNDEHFNLMPVLNIIVHGALRTEREGDSDVHHILLSNNRSGEYVHHQSIHDASWAKDSWNNNCYKLHQRCCRNQLNVAFRDIKGFEFILQPKVFDAGYCQGRCPPRHNPAHHHALLQSLIWQKDHTLAPRPCCTPSKLEVLEILHVDENNSNKLKISTWSDMQVLECACS